MFEVFTMYKALWYRMGCPRDSEFPVPRPVEGETEWPLSTRLRGESSVGCELAQGPYNSDSVI